MYPKIVPVSGNIELIQNSGIQFVDYDVIADWQTEDKYSVINRIKKGYFLKGEDGSFVRLLPNMNAEKGMYSPFDKDVEINDTKITMELATSLELYEGLWFPVPYVNSSKKSNTYHKLPTNWVRARFVRVTDKNAIEKCKERNSQYDHIKTEDVECDPLKDVPRDDRYVFSPFERKSKPCYYRVVLAFDTATQENDSPGYFAPTEEDVDAGHPFELAYSADNYADFIYSRDDNGGSDAEPRNDRNNWIWEWTEKVFKDLYRERIRARIDDKSFKKLLDEKEHHLHYLNVLAFIGMMINPQPVRIIANKTASAPVYRSKDIGVSLVLDIGNARSCAIMVEENSDSTAQEDDFSNSYPLQIRDLNTPEKVYEGPFTSRVEFTRANFDYDGTSARSGRNNAFIWPSMVRVGAEADNLALRREGSEGMSGMVSPKRYIWNTDAKESADWIFNSKSYQTDSAIIDGRLNKVKERAYLSSIGSFFTSEGKAVFALDSERLSNREVMESRFSNSSMMTFMIIEIIMQALTQMNSVSQRTSQGNGQPAGSPRYLKSIILTTPPCMSAEERELFRGCVYEAVGSLWKALGYDRTANVEFKSNAVLKEEDEARGLEQQRFIYPQLPEVEMGWNEAEAGQVVYIYNETQKTFKGRCKDFIASMRRSVSGNRIGEMLVEEGRNGRDLISTRFATLDIGGGTTDLVIKDYSFVKDAEEYSEDIQPHDIYKDGSKIAGDDILYDLIHNCILPRISEVLESTPNNIDHEKPMLALVGQDKHNRMMRIRFVQQILARLAYKLLYHLEHLDPEATSLVISATVREFLEDKEVNSTLTKTDDRMGPFELPSPEVERFVNNIIGEHVEGFSILDMNMSFDIAAINRAISNGSGRFDICRTLDRFCEIITTFNVDLLMLTGRSSKIPGIRAFFMQRLNIPASRIVNMHSYRCTDWYPFNRDASSIGDPKTTASVGALISHMKLGLNKFPNFRFNSAPSDNVNTAHYVGIMTKSTIKDESVLYRYTADRSPESDSDPETRFRAEESSKNGFVLKLPMQLGTRVLSDPTVPAAPLYKLVFLEDPDKVMEVQEARLLKYESPDCSSVKSLFDKMVSSKAKEKLNEALELAGKIEQLKSADGNYEINRKVQEFKEARTSELDKDLWHECKDKYSDLSDFYKKVPEPVPPKKRPIIGGVSEKEQERYNNEVQARDAAVKVLQDEAIKAEYKKLYPEKVTAVVENEGEKKASDLSSQSKSEADLLEYDLMDIIDSALELNIKHVRDEIAKAIAELKPKLQSGRETLIASIKCIGGEDSPYPLHFIRTLNKDHQVHYVDTFDIDSVELESNGRSYKELFKLMLWTVEDGAPDFFMNSGIFSVSDTGAVHKL